MSNILNFIVEDHSNIILSQWMDEWINTYCINLKEQTVSSYKQAIRCHITRVLGDIKLVDLSTQMIQLFYNSLNVGTDIKNPLSAKTIKNIHGILHKSLDIAKRLDYIEKNPADLVILPKTPQKLIKSLSHKQLSQFLNYVKGSKYEYIYLTAIFTGMRESELIGLTWDCVKFDTGELIIEKQLIKEKQAGGKYKFSSLKNSKTRILNPPEFIMNLLYQIYINTNTIKLKMSKFVFCNFDGTHFTQSGVYNYFKKTCQKLGFGTARFHDLRHTFAVISIEAGDDYKTIQNNMGHYSASFTLDVYGFCTNEMRIKSSKRLESYYKKMVVNR